MKLTAALLYNRFDKYNEMFFGNKLPRITIKFCNSRTYVGLFHWKRDVFGPTQLYIAISNKFEYDETILANVLVHEMIHYYIFNENIKDNGPHGIRFHTIAHRINVNNNLGIHISRCTAAPLKALPKVDKFGQVVRYRVIRFKLNGKIYYSRVSKKFTLDGFDDVFDTQYFATTNSKIGGWPNCTKRLSLYTEREVKAMLNVDTELIKISSTNINMF